MLLIDDREPRALRLRLLAEIEGSAQQRLDEADYIVFDKCGHTTAIERKAASDLLASITRRKLYRQLDALKRFTRGVLLVEGFWHVENRQVVVQKRTSPWIASTVQMILLGLQEALGVRMLWVSSQDEFVQTLEALVKQGQKRCFLKGDSD